ncbi:MAG: hydroxyacylglutathione hydrolase [Gammaproteobacteria bacterium]|nr:hydroxyacylglutathione hydrolase [Gammaproteobacteria bacterium]
MITIEPIHAFTDNYIWAICYDKTVWVVDPGDAEPVIAYLQAKKLTLSGVLITHHHHDHCGGVKALRERYAIPVYGPKQDAILATNFVEDKQKILLPECLLSLEVMTIPGHTLEHIAYYCKEEKLLFCGDTLFSAGCGRVFEGTMMQMYQSLMRLAALPDDTLIYCAHEYTLKNLLFAKTVEPNNRDIELRLDFLKGLRGEPSVPTPLALERKINPFLRSHIPAVIAVAENRAGKSLEDPVSVFSLIREWKNSFV